jgi:hypothetical protein
MVNIVAVAPETHANKSWRPLQLFAFAASQPLVPLVGVEFARIAIAMPIAFIEQSGRYVPVALLSPIAGRNFFVGPNGQWLGAYVPAALRGYPFSLARVEGSDKVVLCIDEDSGWIVDSDANPDATRFFEKDGVPSAALKATLEFLGQIEQNRTATDVALAALADAGIIQPWPLQVQDGKQQVPVKGLHCINEAALNALDDEAFLKLRKSSALFLAQAQLMSMQTLGVFQHLMALQQQLAQQTKPLPDVSSMFLAEDSGTIKFN